MIFQNMPKKRRDAGILQITERDIAVLSWIAQQYTISYDQLHNILALFGEAPRKHAERVSYSATLNAVQRWLQLGLIDVPHKILRGYSTHVWLSRRGLTQLGLPYAYYVPKASSIPHLYAVNAIRLHLQSQRIPLAWYSWRTLFHETELRPLPDAELRADATPPIAVQVIERPLLMSSLRDACDTLALLAQRYVRLWYVLHPQVSVPLHDAVGMLDQEVQQHISFSQIEMLEPFPW
jgi:hypothetical protein